MSQLEELRARREPPAPKKAGKDDEDHVAAVAWNALGFIETLWRIEHNYLPKSLDDRLELKKINENPEVIQKILKHCFDGYGPDEDYFMYGHPMDRVDGYGLGEKNKTLFGHIIGTPQRLSESDFNFGDEETVSFIGRTIILPDGENGKVIQVTDLTPPDTGIVADIELEDGKHIGEWFENENSLEAAMKGRPK